MRGSRKEFWLCAGIVGFVTSPLLISGAIDLASKVFTPSINIYALRSDGYNAYLEVLGKDTFFNFESVDSGAPELSELETKKNSDGSNALVIKNLKGQTETQNLTSSHPEIVRNGDNIAFYDPRENGGGSIWFWQPLKGFRELGQLSGQFISLSISQDGKVIQVAQFCGDYSKVSSISTANSAISEYQIPQEDANISCLDPNQVMIMPYRKQAYIYDAVTKSRIAVNGEGRLSQAVSFRNRIWCLRYMDDQYDIIRLSKDKQKIEYSEPLPTNFPKGEPPEDGTHG